MAASGQSSSSSAQQIKCEKILEAVAVELAYMATSSDTPSTDRTDSRSCAKILERGFFAVYKIPGLKWSSVVEQLVSNVKLCMFKFDLKEPLMKLAQEKTRHTLQSLEVKKPPKMICPVSSIGVELLFALAMAIKGKDAFCLYRSVLINDYPPQFHFLDLLHPDAAALICGGGIVDQCLLLKLVNLLVTESRNTLIHAETSPAGSRCYLSSSQVMASSLEELILCLIKLHQNRKHVLFIDMVQQALITTLNVTPMPKMSGMFFERLTSAVSGLIENLPPSASDDRDMVMDIVLEIIRADSAHSRVFVKNLLTTQFVESSMDIVTTFMSTLEKIPPCLKSVGPITELEFLTILAEKYVTEFRLVIVPSINLILELLTKCNWYELSLIQNRGKAITTVPGGIHQVTDFCKSYIYAVDKIGKLVRCYNQAMKFTEGVIAKTDYYHPYLYVFRQSLQFFEAIMHSIGRRMWPATDENKDLVFTVIENFERFVAMSNDLINCNSLFIAQGTFDCLASITSHMFSQLSDETQQMCLDNFLIYAKSDNVAIRIKAGRCLGIFLEFDDVAQADGLFLLHAFDIIERNFDIKDLECGAVYGWGFGNFTGVLATHYQGVLINVGGPEDFLPRLRALVQKCMQSPKSLHNGYRALGNIFHWAPTSYFSKDPFVEFLKEAIQLLTKQIGKGKNFKARWNACCALGNLFKNSALAEFGYKQYFPEILTALTTCILKSESYKEQGHCLMALQQLSSRTHYGSLIKHLWESLVRVIEEPPPSRLKPSEKSEGSELRSEELQYRVGQCITHFISLMEMEDFLPLNEFILEHSDTLVLLFNKLKADVRVPEQLVGVDRAYNHLRDLCKLDKIFARLESVGLLCDLLDTTIS